MRKFRIRALLFAFVFSLPVVGAAVEPDDITGTWLTADEDGNRDSVVEIFRDGLEYVGELRWIRNSVYPEGDPMAGEPVVDRENPDPALRKRPLLGVRILWGLRFDDDEWVGGRTYDARRGKVYKSKLKLKNKNRLKLRGYIGTPMLGKSVIWTRSPIPPTDSKEP